MSAGTDEVHLWRWRYINERGKRVESSWHMAAREAAHYRDVERIEETLEIRQPMGSAGDWGTIAEQATPGSITNAPGISSDSGN